MRAPEPGSISTLNRGSSAMPAHLTIDNHLFSSKKMGIKIKVGHGTGGMGDMKQATHHYKEMRALVGATRVSKLSGHF